MESSTHCRVLPCARRVRCFVYIEIHEAITIKPGQAQARLGRTSVGDLTPLSHVNEAPSRLTSDLPPSQTVTRHVTPLLSALRERRNRAHGPFRVRRSARCTVHETRRVPRTSRELLGPSQLAAEREAASAAAREPRESGVLYVTLVSGGFVGRYSPGTPQEHSGETTAKAAARAPRRPRRVTAAC